jgi:hypothetical protein
MSIYTTMTRLARAQVAHNNIRARNRPSRTNASAATLEACPSAFSDNLHRDAEWHGNRLIFRRRVVATVIPDRDWPSMWRVRLPDGHVTDMVNYTRARDAARALAFAHHG